MSAETLIIEGDLAVDNTPSVTTDEPIVQTYPGAFTILGGHVAQGGTEQRSGAMLRIGSMTQGATKSDTEGTYFEWFSSVDFNDYGQHVVYLYIGEFPFQMWGYFDVTVASDYWGPGKVGRGAITKRFPVAFNTYQATYPGALHAPAGESSAVIAAAGGIIDYVTIGEIEQVEDKLRVPIYFLAGSHSLAGIGMSGMFTRAYNEAGYPYAAVESNLDTVTLNNAVEIQDLQVANSVQVDGDIVIAGTIESTAGGFVLPDGTVLDEAADLNSGGGSSAEANKLTTPDLTTDVVIVDNSKHITVDGTMTFTAPMGDISMGVFGAQ